LKLISRRSFLVGGLAAAVPLSVPVNAAAEVGPRPSRAPALRIPRTQSRARSRRAGGTRVTATAFPLSHLGLAWTGDDAAVRLRTRSGWSDWRPARGCRAGGDDTAEAGGTALIHAADAIGYEVQAGGGAVAAVELNTVDGPLVTVGAPPGVLPAAAGNTTLDDGPRYLSRAAWGADESRRVTTLANGAPNPLSFYSVSTLTVHHEGNAYDTTLEDAHVRALYAYQTTPAAQGGSGLDDLGYHLLIGAEGTVYEGRWSGTDLVPVFGAGAGPDGRPQMVNGAHLPGFNAGNIGVCLLGDYTDAAPAAAAYRSLAAVLATLADACGLDPTATTRYVNPADVANPTRTDPPRSATVRTVTTHRDWHAANPAAGATDCPGTAFHPTMDRVRRDVADLMTRF